jgi:ribosomal protein L5|tara:strand:- start:364 stop:1008 length:645 start_codon:yes stop_codon:yes gene_type:complete
MIRKGQVNALSKDLSSVKKPVRKAFISGKPRLHFVTQDVEPDIVRRSSLSNYYKVPKVSKVSVHVNFTEALKDLRSLGLLYNVLFLLTGAKPRLIKARKSISQFKVRKGSFVGCKVVLPPIFSHSFLDYVFSVAMNHHYNYEVIGLSDNREKGVLYIGFDQFEDFKYLDPIGLYLRRFSGFDIKCVLKNRGEKHVSSEFFSRLGISPLQFVYKD